jgi:acyl-coenzyme A synthetase/AMP-(fatty) acid ligase
MFRKPGGASRRRSEDDVILANTLGDTSAPMTNDNSATQSTLDDLFRRALARRPDAPALIDPPDRSSFTDGPVRRLSYAEADRAIAALARLREFGLPTDAVVAIQLPNTVESVIALLAVMRAGLIAAPLPLLWRHADAATALSRVAARALIGCQRVGDDGARRPRDAYRGRDLHHPLPVRLRREPARRRRSARRHLRRR